MPPELQSFGGSDYSGQGSGAQGVKKMSDAADEVMAAFVGGGISLTNEACDALINGLKQMQTSVRNALERSDALTADPMIGETPAAKVYRPFLPTVATDPVQGFIPVMKALQQKLADAMAAIEKSRNAIVSTDQNAGTGLSNLDHH